jgi:hypothetical protein
VSRIVRNEDGVFLEIPVGLGTVTTPLERLSAADQGTYVQPTAFLPMEFTEPAAATFTGCLAYLKERQ